MKALDDGNFACYIFVDIEKAFDTVDLSILLSKLCHYGIRGLTNKWFESYINILKFLAIPILFKIILYSLPFFQIGH